MSEIKRSRLACSVIDRMDVEVLRRILEEDFDDPDGIIDEEAWLYACEALARKEKEQGTKASDAETALEEFQREYLPYINSDTELFDDENRSAENITALPKKKTFGRSYFRILAAVVAVLILGTATASAMGFDIWNGIISWTRETFGFSSNNNAEPALREIPEQLEELAAAFEQYGISRDKLPTYIPNGYVHKETKIAGAPTYDMFVSMLVNRNKSIVFQYRLHKDSSGFAEIQKDETDPQIYTLNGIDFYIFTNKDLYVGTWMDGNLECLILGIDSYDELIKIINSIYGG